MKISAVIAEFNPFHSGHKYLIDCAKKDADNYILAVMSGNFVQRGSCAIFSKWDRTCMALNGGVDLVIELPTPWAMSTAQKFAFGAVNIIDSLDCVDELFFGSECGDIDKLQQLSEILKKEENLQNISQYMDIGIMFAKARQLCISENFGQEFSEMLSGANNNLALEYISEVQKINTAMHVSAYKRIGSGHDEQSYTGSYPCASSIRDEILSGKDKIFFNFDVYKMGHLERAILYAVRKMTAEDLLKYPDISEGLENRIVSCAGSARSVEELFDSVKTKRYTHARIRRIIMSAFLGITAEIQNKVPPYIKVLGFNDRGREILKKASETAKLPIIHKYSDVKVLSDFAQKVYELESRCTDIFSLACDSVKPCGREMTENQIIMI